uniref:Uncharacterized protein n=1 Tax=Ciona intestinalis TaxID=7719 RepID=F7AZJ4_CIOIN
QSKNITYISHIRVEGIFWTNCFSHEIIALEKKHSIDTPKIKDVTVMPVAVAHVAPCCCPQLGHFFTQQLCFCLIKINIGIPNK